MRALRSLDLKHTGSDLMTGWAADSGMRAGTPLQIVA